MESLLKAILLTKCIYLCLNTNQPDIRIVTEGKDRSREEYTRSGSVRKTDRKASITSLLKGQGNKI